jgi:hypothetical protein
LHPEIPSPTITLMAKQDQPEQSAEKPAHARRVLLRPRIFEQVEQMAERDEADIAEIVNRAVRELLEREKLWPPPSGKSNDD